MPRIAESALGLSSLGFKVGIVASLLSLLGLVVSPRALATDEEVPLSEVQIEKAFGSSAQSISVRPQSAQTQALNLVLNLGDRRLMVYQGNMLINSYPVAVGREGWQTPTGEFSVLQKQVNPAWEHPFTGQVVPPGPANPLGTRWIGFWTDGTNHIGFHGTPDESLIGSAVSHGCVRMRNEDVIALYEQVEMGTPIRVVQ